MLVVFVQCGDLAAQFGQITVVMQHIIGTGESFLARELGGHDRANSLCRQSATLHRPADLQRFIAIDDQHALYQVGITGGFEQQRNHQQDRVRQIR